MTLAQLRGDLKDKVFSTDGRPVKVLRAPQPESVAEAPPARQSIDMKPLVDAFASMLTEMRNAHAEQLAAVSADRALTAPQAPRRWVFRFKRDADGRLLAIIADRKD